MISITFYTTAGCHLCELAETLLNDLSLHHQVTINPTEIGDDDDLVLRYGTTIPVVKFNDDSELNWPFNHHDLEIKIGQLQSS
ncbi:MAG: glutaredoxin family protein [Piscirickettsiaceae bacterium]|nr:glutaredoxin family protein [Piscirickettsiaceae bacterium]